MSGITVAAATAVTAKVLHAGRTRLKGMSSGMKVIKRMQATP
jgi:hypothetical protein